jgi:hypothetical protein
MGKIIKLNFIILVWLLGITYAATSPSFNTTLNIAVGGANSGTLSIEDFFLESSQGTKEPGIVSVESISNNTIELSVAQDSSSNFHILDTTALGHSMLDSSGLTESLVTGFSNNSTLNKLPLQFIFQADIAFNYSDSQGADIYMCSDIGFMYSNSFTAGSIPWVILSNNAGMNNYNFTTSDSSLGSYIASITCKGITTGQTRYFGITGDPGSPNTLLIIPYTQYGITFQGMSGVSNIGVTIEQSQSLLNSSHAVNVAENPQESGNYNFSAFLPYRSTVKDHSWYESVLGATILNIAGLNADTETPPIPCCENSVTVKQSKADFILQIGIALTYNGQNFSCNHIGAVFINQDNRYHVPWLVWMLMTNNYHYGSNAAYSYNYSYNNQIDCQDSQGDTSQFVIYSWGDQSTFGIRPTDE